MDRAPQRAGDVDGVEARVAAPSPSPAGAGESHMSLDKVLRSNAKWILKVSPDSAGDAHGTIYPGFFRIARPAGRQCGARSDGDFVYRFVGYAVRSTELLRHSLVCQDQRTVAANGVGFGPWGAEPRHLQPGLPHARPAGFREDI